MCFHTRLIFQKYSFNHAALPHVSKIKTKILSLACKAPLSSQARFPGLPPQTYIHAKLDYSLFVTQILIQYCSP